MKTALTNFFRDGFRPVEVGGLEYFILRLVFAGLVWLSMTYWPTIPFVKQPHPAGLAQFMDLTWLADAGHLRTAQYIALAGLAVYVSGRFLWLALPVVCFVQLAINSLYNSQGYTFHGHQLVGLVLFAQTVVAVVLGLRSLKGALPPAAVRRAQAAGLMLYYSQMAVAGAYAVSVVSKMKYSDGKWLFRSHYHAVQLIKTDRQHYYSKPDPVTPLGSSDAARKAEWVASNPTFARVMFAGGFFAELLVFLGLKNRRWAVLAGLAVMGLHWAIAFVMDLTFPLNEILVLLLFINPVYWLGRLITKVRSAGPPSDPAVPASAPASPA